MIIYIYNMYVIYIFKQWSNNNNHWITLSLTEPCDLHYHFSCTFSATNRLQKKKPCSQNSGLWCQKEESNCGLFLFGLIKKKVSNCI